MRRLAWLSLAAVAACQPRSELLLGFATDLHAPDRFDDVQLAVTGPEGVVEDGETWQVTGLPSLPVNLPASIGLYSDGGDVRIDLTLTGTKGATVVATQHAILDIIGGQTLFYRMSLVSSCVGKTDCLESQTCVEGACRDPNIDSAQLPDFTPELVTELGCDSGTAFLNTDTGEPMKVSDDAPACDSSLCTQGTCLKPPPPAADPSATRTVAGAAFTTFIQPNGTQTRPNDLSALVPTILIPGGGDGFTSIAGTGSSDGSFHVDGVAQGDYYLQLGSDYIVSSSSSLDLSVDTLGRPTTVTADPAQTTQLAIGLTGLDPWVDGDQLELYSADADTWYESLQQCVAIAPGATSLTGYTIGRQCAFTSIPGRGANLIANDDVAVAQLTVKQTAAGVAYAAATRFATPARFTQTDGSTTPVSVALQPVAQTQTLSADLRATAWDAAVGFDGAHATLMNPEAGTTAFTGPADGTFAFVIGTPNSTVFGAPGASSDFLDVQVPHGSPDTVVAGMTYATPFAPGEAWGLVAGASTTWHVLLALPGTTCPAFSSCDRQAAIRFNGPLSAFAQPITPLLGPVRAPTIADPGGAPLDLFASPHLTTTSPTLAWTAPTVGVGRDYIVTVLHVTNNAGVTEMSQVATITTSHTSVAVPPGVLAKNAAYVFEIAANTNPNPDAPRRLVLPETTSNIVSTIVIIGEVP